MSESIRFNASLNTAGFDSGAARLQQVASSASSKVSASFASMGATIAGVIAPFVGLYAAINSVKSALDLSGKLNDLSKTTGETAGNLAVLQRAFDNTGIGAEKVGTSIQKMSEFIVGLQQGSPAATKAADALGISMADLAGKTPIEQMRALMAALGGISDPALRSATAVDVFGKAGRDVVPLAQDFGGALAEARGELGSLPRILDENAASLDQLGDKLTNAVGSKLTELAVGLAAGATGANDFATALAKIDAAGFGEQLGNSIRAAFAAPQEYAQAIGEFLIAGVLKAANALDAAMRNAVNVYYEMMDNPTFWNGLFMYVEAGFAKVGQVFFGTIADALKAALSAMDWNPLWRPFTALAKGAIDDVSAGIAEAGDTINVNLSQGALMMKAAWNGAMESSKYVYEDTFGAEQHLKKAAEHMANAQQAAADMEGSSARVSDNFGRGSKQITDALNAMRGFELGKGSESKKPDWTQSDQAPPSFDAPPPPRSGGGDSSSRARHARGTPSSMSEDERVADLRGKSAQRRHDQRASDLESIGRFGSSVRASMAGEKAYARAMDKAALKKEYGTFNYRGREEGSQNAGDAMKGFFKDVGKMNALDKMRDTPGYDKTKSNQENFKNYLRQQSKTDEERAQQAADETGGGKSPSAEPTSSLSATEATLKEVLKTLNTKLPSRVLSA